MFHPRQQNQPDMSDEDDDDCHDIESAGQGEDSIISSDNFAGDE